MSTFGYACETCGDRVVLTKAEFDLRAGRVRCEDCLAKTARVMDETRETESLFPSTGYTALIYRQEPETRWFWRYVLRRKGRSRLIHASALDSFTLERRLNGISNAAFVMRDPWEHLVAKQAWGPDHPSYDERDQ